MTDGILVAEDDTKEKEEEFLTEVYASQGGLNPEISAKASLILNYPDDFTKILQKKQKERVLVKKKGLLIVMVSSFIPP